MKLGPATKDDKRNMGTSKRIDDGVRSLSCDVVVFFPIYGQFQASGSRIPDRWSMKLTFSLIVTFYLT